MLIGLFSAVPEEGNVFIKHLNKKSVVCGKHIYGGRIQGKDIIYIISGVGKANAAHAATVLLEKFSPDAAILFGVGGAYPSSGLGTGDIAIAEKEIYGDEGVMVKDGFYGMERIGIPLLRRGNKNYLNEFPLHRKFVKAAMNAIPVKGGRWDFHVKSGAFVTVSTCTGTRKRALDIEKRFNAICENMEGAAAAHVCAMYGVPMLEVRGISNIVEDRDKGKWDMKIAAENCRKVVNVLLREGRWD